MGTSVNLGDSNNKDEESLINPDEDEVVKSEDRTSKKKSEKTVTPKHQTKTPKREKSRKFSFINNNLQANLVM